MKVHNQINMVDLQLLPWHHSVFVRFKDVWLRSAIEVVVTRSWNWHFQSLSCWRMSFLYQVHAKSSLEIRLADMAYFSPLWRDAKGREKKAIGLSSTANKLPPGPGNYLGIYMVWCMRQQPPAMHSWSQFAARVARCHVVTRRRRIPVISSGMIAKGSPPREKKSVLVQRFQLLTA